MVWRKIGVCFRQWTASVFCVKISLMVLQSCILELELWYLTICRIIINGWYHVLENAASFFCYDWIICEALFSFLTCTTVHFIFRTKLVLTRGLCLYLSHNYVYVKHLMQPIINMLRFNEFGDDGGPAAKHLNPKFDVFSKHVATRTGFQVPHVEVRRFSISIFCSHFCWLISNFWLYIYI